MERHVEDPDWIARMVTCIEVTLRASGLPPDAASSHGAQTWSELRASLAAHNLGLVEIARPAAFSWPGYWIAIVDDGTGPVPVVMYGSPSATMWPSDAEGVVVGGFVLAPFDASLPAAAPYGPPSAATGTVTGLFVAADTAGPMQPLPIVEAVAGQGLEGDRYHAGGGTFSGPVGYEVTLIDGAAADDLPVEVGDLRRNVVTTGIDLNALVGERFAVGGAVLIGRRLCEPCRHLEDLLAEKVIQPLVHRGGLRADILVGGPIAIGDRVVRLR